mmetsp:Transcript_68501/g.193418  ORF Transcript_68501/g.193418 Transcript_68501/m.193418 type:complete len:91 (+) Transcript_68501:1968-2240(+)
MSTQWCAIWSGVGCSVPVTLLCHPACTEPPSKLYRASGLEHEDLAFPCVHFGHVRFVQMCSPSSDTCIVHQRTRKLFGFFFVGCVMKLLC